MREGCGFIKICPLTERKRTDLLKSGWWIKIDPFQMSEAPFNYWGPFLLYPGHF